MSIYGRWAVRVEDWEAYMAQAQARQARGEMLLVVLLGTLTGFASALVGLALVSLLQEVAAQARRGNYEDSKRP